MAGAYTPVSDVKPQQDLSLDTRDLVALMDGGDKSGSVDWAAVKAIYEKGRNSKKGDGTFRTLLGVATKKEVLSEFPSGTQVLASSSYLDANVQSALNGSGHSKGLSSKARRQLVDKGILAILYGEILEELTAARAKVKQGMTDNARGAPHNVDEAWAYYAGAADASGAYPYALCSTAGKRERNFKLEGKVDAPLQAALAAAQKATQKGDAAALDAAIAQAKGYLNGIFYLASIRYVSSIASSADVAQREVQIGEGWGFFQAIRPAVAMASAEAASTVEAVYERPASAAVTPKDVSAVYAALNRPEVLKALGVPSSLVFKAPPA